MNNQDLELASISRRIFAFLIDEILVTVLVYLVFWDSLIASSTNVEDLAVVVAGLLIPVLIIKFLYQTVFIWYYGATVGKIILKIRTIDYNHFGRVSLSNSIIRSAGRIASEYFLYIGYIVALLTEGRQTFHDKIGRTLVVNA